MRVLYVNPFSQQISGPDESLITLLPSLKKLGVVPHVMLPRDGPQVGRYKALGAEVHIGPMSVLSRSLGPRGTAALPFRLARGTAAVARVIRSARIEVVHTNMEVVLDGALAARRTGIPHVLHYRGNTLDEPRAAFAVLTRIWAGTAHRVFCISRGTARIFESRGFGSKVVVLNDPVEVDLFRDALRSEEVRRDLGADANDLLLGMVARIHPRKDVETFLKATAILAGRIPELKIAIVGSAEAPEELRYDAEMRALASELGIANRLKWAGTRRDIPLVMKALDLFMLCSRNEGFGIVVAEAIAAGCPVVLTDEGALPEFVGPRLELLAGARNAQAFAAAAERILRQPAGYRARDVVGSGNLVTPDSAAKVVFDVYVSAGEQQARARRGGAT